MLVTWAVIVLLILVNALYVAAEFAAVGVRRSRIRRLAEDGNPLARRLQVFIEDPHGLDNYIAACQIGITLSSLVLGAYGQATLSGPLTPRLVGLGVDPGSAQPTAAVVILLGLTITQMILGELVPKSLALQYPTRAALGTVLPMQWSLRVFRPFIVLLNGSGGLLLRLAGLRNAGHRHIHSPEEIALLIAESRDGGLLEPEEQVRLHRALSLGLRTAKQLMVPRERLAAVRADMPFEQLVQEMAASPYTRLPVYRSSLDDIIGFVRTKMVVLHYVRLRNQGSIENVLQPISFVDESMPADRLLAFLRQRRSHQAIVRDATGRVTGLVTLADVLADLLGRTPDEFGQGPREAGRG